MIIYRYNGKSSQIALLSYSAIFRLLNYCNSARDTISSTQKCTVLECTSTRWINQAESNKKAHQHRMQQV